MSSRLATRTAVAAAASLAVFAPLAGCSSNDGDAPRTSSSQPSTRPETGSSSPAPSAGASDGEYEDGTYTARGYYGGAPSYMTFTVTLDDGVITDVSSELMPDNNATSRGYQEKFAAALPEEVVGKSVDDVKVGKLAGSSSCGDGFNDALAKIREEAATR